jgi:predicted metal-binding protein
MNLCGEPVAMALCAPGKDSLLFANVDPETQVNEALRLVDLYLSAEGGVIIDARPIGSLRFSMRGRVPAH